MSDTAPLAIRCLEAALLIARANDNPGHHYHDGDDGQTEWCNCGRPWPCEIGAAWDLLGPPSPVGAGENPKEPTDGR